MSQTSTLKGQCIADFSFLLVNDKLTLCLHGNMVVCDHPTYNNHHHASGFDYEPNINLKRPVHRR
ncbi:hypothetical protein, partial [Escherichia coli]|uniref:hypothetical protein n=1 Tax=Escherichia coli TaxID=562 RepID=UPI00197AE0A2